MGEVTVRADAMGLGLPRGRHASLRHEWLDWKNPSTPCSVLGWSPTTCSVQSGGREGKGEAS